MPITFEEVTQTMLSLVRRIGELEAENKGLREFKEAIRQQNVREPDKSVNKE